MVSCQYAYGFVASFFGKTFLKEAVDAVGIKGYETKVISDRELAKAYLPEELEDILKDNPAFEKWATQPEADKLMTDFMIKVYNSQDRSKAYRWVEKDERGSLPWRKGADMLQSSYQYFFPKDDKEPTDMKKTDEEKKVYIPGRDYWNSLSAEEQSKLLKAGGITGLGLGLLGAAYYHRDKISDWWRGKSLPQELPQEDTYLQQSQKPWTWRDYLPSLPSLSQSPLDE